MSSEHKLPDRKAIIPADPRKALSLPAEMVERGLVLATKLELKQRLQDCQTPLNQCPRSYNPATVSFSKNGEYALITAFGRAVSSPLLIIWNATDGWRTIAMMREQDREFVYSTVVSRNAEFALIGYGNGQILRWDIKNHRASYLPIDGSDPHRRQRFILPIKVAPDRVIEDHRTYTDTTHPDSNQRDRMVTSMVLSPDERYFAECAQNVYVQIRESRSGRIHQRFHVGYVQYPHQIAFSHDGGKLVVARGQTTSRGGGMQSLVTLFDLHGRRAPLTFAADRIVAATAVAFFPDNQRVVSLESGGVITVWNAQDGTEIRHWSHVKSPNAANDLVSRRALSPNLIMEERNPMVWGLSGVAVSPDGERILTGGGDRFMRLWSPEGHQLFEYCHSARVVSVAFTPDGRRALSGCWDGVVCLWNLPP
jgi:WD40 repeat protein